MYLLSVGYVFEHTVICFLQIQSLGESLLIQTMDWKNDIHVINIS